MRFIDADEFNKQEVLEKLRTAEFDDEIKDAVEKIPTSYDVGKVIEEIEDTITPTTEYRYKFCGTVEARRCMNYESCECCIAERMIEIIKSGGVADD